MADDVKPASKSRTKKKSSGLKKSNAKSSTHKTDENTEPQNNLIETDAIKKTTKATFDLYLEQAQANAERERQSPKKGKTRSKKKPDEEVLLENLRNSGEFQKDKDEETQKRNTYDPDTSKTKSNKRRDKLKGGVDNKAFIEDQLNTAGETSTDRPLTIEELSSPKKSSKKKKSKRAKQEQEEEEETTFIQDPESEVQADEGKSKKRKSKRSKSRSHSANARTSQHEEVIEEPAEVVDDGQVMEVVIHRTDKLRANFLIQHPLVRIHLVDADTGQHVSKHNRDRAVTSFYETIKRDGVPEQILPVMTQSYDFKKMKSVLPWWDENVIFNECFNYFTRQKPNVIIFFEILDFVSMNRASKQQQYSNTAKGDEGWHKEAWAFLKVRGANGHLNVNEQLRLQLFEVPRGRFAGDEVPVYQYWKSNIRRTYPSTLYVSVNAIIPQDNVAPAPRSKFPTQEETGTKTLKQMQEALTTAKLQKTSTAPTPSQWNRLQGQMCKLPNKPLLTLTAGKMGCLVLNFSHKGRHLACACHDKSAYPIKVYSIPDGKLEATLNGHYNNIYELAWSKSDKFILSASSDGTARVWDVATEKCMKMMSHPTFVYCAKFHPRVSKVIVTGSYDNVIRIWQLEGDDLHANLYQELSAHTSYINSLCFDEDGGKLYSADAAGIINVWNVYVTEKASIQGVTRDWKLSDSIDNEELKDLNISYIMMHPNGRRLLIQTKDNTLRMLDLRMMSITQRYVGALNFRQLVKSDITPCGSFVFSGSEDGCVYVWNTETGDQVADYPELHFTQAVNDVKFHPHDHIAAFCSRGDNHKILVFEYGANITDSDAKQFLHSRPKMVQPVDEPIKLTEADTVAEDLSLQVEAKKQRAMKKLESVLAFNRNATRQQQTHAMDSMAMQSTGQGLATGTYGSTNGWGSTFDRSYANTLGTSIMSPHAQVTGEVEAVRSHLTSQMEYMKGGNSGANWRPGFSPIGRQTPTMNMKISAKSNTGNFSVVGADDIKPIGEAITLYDYQAQRSDELSFRQGEIITILYKDTNQWWMGILQTNNSQGFFPSNYIEEITPDAKDKTSDGEELDEHSSRHRTTAVMDRGQLKFISGTESDASSGDQLENSYSRRRKRRTRAQLRGQKSLQSRDAKAPLNSTATG